MVDKICDKLMNRVKAKMPEVDDERAEVIRYGFELIFGEIPKILLMFLLAFIMGKIKYFVISVAIICPYRTFSRWSSSEKSYRMFYCNVCDVSWKCAC